MFMSMSSLALAASPMSVACLPYVNVICDLFPRHWPSMLASCLCRCHLLPSRRRSAPPARARRSAPPGMGSRLASWYLPGPRGGARHPRPGRGPSLKPCYIDSGPPALVRRPCSTSCSTAIPLLLASWYFLDQPTLVAISVPPTLREGQGGTTTPAGSGLARMELD